MASQLSLKFSPNAACRTVQASTPRRSAKSRITISIDTSERRQQLVVGPQQSVGLGRTAALGPPFATQKNEDPRPEQGGGDVRARESGEAERESAGAALAAAAVAEAAPAGAASAVERGAGVRAPAADAKVPCAARAGSSGEEMVALTSEVAVAAAPRLPRPGAVEVVPQADADVTLGLAGRATGAGGARLV